MPISSIAGGSLSRATSSLSGAVKASGNSFADLFDRAKGASSGNVNSATTGAKVGELTRDAETKLSELKRTMQELLTSAGIDTTWQIRLQSDGQGGVRVNADHPEADKIQQLLQANPDLIEKFNQLHEAYKNLRTNSGAASPGDEAFASAFSLVFDDGKGHVEYE